MSKKVIIVCYDISEDKLRTRLSKYLEKYGVRVQFSVYEIQNSQRVLDIVLKGIERNFKPQFSASDSVYIFRANHEDTIRIGVPDLLDKDLIML